MTFVLFVLLMLAPSLSSDFDLREETVCDFDAKILGTIPAVIVFSGTGRISGKLLLSVKSASDVLRPKAKSRFWFNRICGLQETLNS